MNTTFCTLLLLLLQLLLIIINEKIIYLTDECCNQQIRIRIFKVPCIQWPSVFIMVTSYILALILFCHLTCISCNEMTICFKWKIHLIWKCVIIYLEELSNFNQDTLCSNIPSWMSVDMDGLFLTEVNKLEEWSFV